MSDVKPNNQRYTLDIQESKDTPEEWVFTFVPTYPQKKLAGAGSTPRVPQYVVLVQRCGKRLSFDWTASPDDPGNARKELQREARQRINARIDWIDRVNDLVKQVEQWAKGLGWATRRIEKKLDDSQIGKHRVPALMMQDGICRILLEPVGRTTPGTDGLVDLYLMPAYDDIASLYFYENRWNLHYPRSDASGVPVREASSEPLSKETLQKVLDELKAHAA